MLATILGESQQYFKHSRYRTDKNLFLVIVVLVKVFPRDPSYLIYGIIQIVIRIIIDHFLDVMILFV